MTQDVCSNCSLPAGFSYHITATKHIPYCSSHLPGFLQQETYRLLVTKTEFLESKKAEALKKLSFSEPAQEPTKKPRTNKKSPKIETPEIEPLDTLVIPTDEEGVTE